MTLTLRSLCSYFIKINGQTASLLLMLQQLRNLTLQWTRLICLLFLVHDQNCVIIDVYKIDLTSGLPIERLII